jgi:protein-S-isoprenylcysteine O-methyltransferase Ste14
VGVLDAKAEREEAWLRAVHPGYAAYARRVRWRFLPGLR